jgi:hypothetical protein
MDLIQQFTEDAEEKSELLEWDISPRDDIPKVIVKSNDNGTHRLFQGVWSHVLPTLQSFNLTIAT